MPRHGRRPLAFWLLAAFFALFVLFLYGPTITIVILSFQGPSGGLTFPMNGVSVHWFRNLFEKQMVGDFAGSFQRSIILGVATMLASLPLMIPLIIMGGILTGWFTPTEAGMIAAVYILVVLIPLLNRGHVRFLLWDFVYTGMLYAIPLAAVAGASAFGWMLGYLRGPDIVGGWIKVPEGPGLGIVPDEGVFGAPIASFG